MVAQLTSPSCMRSYLQRGIFPAAGQPRTDIREIFWDHWSFDFFNSIGTTRKSDYR
jgi:hypothetical protein